MAVAFIILSHPCLNAYVLDATTEGKRGQGASESSQEGVDRDDVCLEKNHFTCFTRECDGLAAMVEWVKKSLRWMVRH